MFETVHLHKMISKKCLTKYLTQSCCANKNNIKINLIVITMIESLSISYSKKAPSQTKVDLQYVFHKEAILVNFYSLLLYRN
jgi:hypothetical protein